MNIYIVKAVGDRDMKSYNVKAFISKSLALELARKCNAAVHAQNSHYNRMSKMLADAGYMNAGFDGTEERNCYLSITKPETITILDPFYHAGDLQDIEYQVEEMESS